MACPLYRRHRLREEWSVFVRGISEKWKVLEIRNYCSKFGFVSDVYVPRFQINDSNRKFGFVRFLRWDDANKAISKLDGKVWMGRTLEASFAKHFKRSRMVDFGRRAPGFKVNEPSGRKVPRPGVFADLQPIRGEANPAMVEWLQRSLICSEIRDVGRGKIELLLKRNVPFVTKVSSLGARSFLVTFDSFEHLKQALADSQESLRKVFSGWKPWEEAHDGNTLRRTWVEISGLPPNFWSSQNFNSIVAGWGFVFNSAESIEDTNCYEVARVCIQTKFKEHIQGSHVFLGGSSKFTVHFYEVGGANTDIVQDSDTKLASTGAPIDRQQDLVMNVDASDKNSPEQDFGGLRNVEYLPEGDQRNREFGEDSSDSSQDGFRHYCPYRPAGTSR